MSETPKPMTEGEEKALAAEMDRIAEEHEARRQKEWNNAL